MNLTRVWHFIRLTRPVFLLGGILLYGLGALIAATEGAAIDLGRLMIGQMMVTSIQLMTHYANEYFDLQSDTLNQNRTPFSGGSGVLVNKLLSPETAHRAALLAGLIALLTMIAVGNQAPVVFFLGGVSLIAAWSYSAPPLALARSGWGEISASLIVAFLVPVVGYVLQSNGRFSLILLLICIPMILIHFAMLIAFQIPDQLADEAVGKKTLSVRLGRERAATVHNAALVLACLAILGLFLSRWPGAQLAWLALPLAAWQMYTVGRGSSTSTQNYLVLTLGAIALFAFTAALWFAGFLVDWVGT